MDFILVTDPILVFVVNFKAVVDVVELDPAIVRVATEHFDFKPNERLNVITCDGLTYINNLATESGKNNEMLHMLP